MRRADRRSWRDGGSVMASFETGLYDDAMQARARLGHRRACSASRHWARTRRGSAMASWGGSSGSIRLLDGFSNTDWLPGAQCLQPLAPVERSGADGDPAVRELSAGTGLSAGGQDRQPAVVAKEMGASRLVYFPSDIERTAWMTGNTDLARLLQNAVRWVSHGSQPVTITARDWSRLSPGRRRPVMPCIC